MDKKIIKFDDTEIEEYKFHQNKSHISINSIYINKTLVSKSFILVKKILNTLLVIKMLRKLDLYAYSIQKCIYRTDFDETKCMYFFI